MEIMRSLEKAEDWERLSVWMVVVWSFLPLLSRGLKTFAKQAYSATRTCHTRRVRTNSNEYAIRYE